jgi:hypothetical protein
VVVPSRKTDPLQWITVSRRAHLLPPHCTRQIECRRRATIARRRPCRRRTRSFAWAFPGSLCENERASLLLPPCFAGPRLQLGKRAYDRKIPIVAGTDGTPGFTLHRELENYAEAGIPNAEVLAIATLGAAKIMHVDRTSGSIAPGKDADLVIVDGDPLATCATCATS